MNHVRLLTAVPPLVFAALVVTALGCDADPAAAVEEDRQPIGKADALDGSCGTAAANACGGPATVGLCWCDGLCAQFGDCCADKATVCDDALVACGDLDLSQPADDAQCEARADCTPFLVADCPACGGGTLVCIEVDPVACAELDTNDLDQRESCDARPDCALMIEPACPDCPGGSEVCVPLEPVACEELDPSDLDQRASCAARSDCALVIEPACPSCEGGTEVCITTG